MIAGIFQGGGARGTAYSGALAALEDEDIWFRRVAGASAGAITAALVAAGLDSNEIRRAVPAGLGRLSPHQVTLREGSLVTRARLALRGARRHRRIGALFPIDELDEWLLSTIGLDDGDRPTFSSLFRRERIEFHVVAANVSRNEQMVFNYRQTPNADVVRAVVASSAIPAAFPPAYLIVRRDHATLTAAEFLSRPESECTDGADAYARETLVDGGVWANYPAFVFKDLSFRQWAGLQMSLEPVVGFLLDRDEPSASAVGSDRRQGSRDEPSQSSERDVGSDIAPADRALLFERVESGPPRARLGVVLAASLAPALVLGAVAGFASGLGRVAVLLLSVLLYTAALFFLGGRHWRTNALDQPAWDSATVAGGFLDEMIQQLYGSRLLPWVPVIGVVSFLAVAAWGISTIQDQDAVWLFTGLYVILGGAALLAAVFSVVVLLVVRYAAPVIASSAMGTATTLLAASTQPPHWLGAHGDDHVVRVPVLAGVETLSFDLDEDTIGCVHERAYESSREQLRGLGLRGSPEQG